MLIGRLETDSERLARLSEYHFPASLASSLPVDPIITTVPVNDGRGRAYGFDVLLSRMTAPVDARMRGWVSYTWGRAELDAYGRTYPFDYDRRHAVSAVLSYRASPKWELASTIRWATGFPRTAPLGIRVARETGLVILSPGHFAPPGQPARDSAGRLVYEVNYGGVANLNNARLPDFARTDVRASWKPRGTNGRWEFYVEVINLMNRKNIGALAAELANDPTSDRPRIVETSSETIPRVPTIGIRWRF
jgi:hypothetical protein